MLLDRAPGGTRAQASAATAFAARNDLRARNRVPEIGMVTVSIPPGESFSDLSRRLKTDPRVRSISLERTMQLRNIPADPALFAPETSPGTPSGVKVQWTLAREGLYSAWDVTRGTGALVAIIDSGIDGGHPELSQKIAAAVDQESLDDTGPPTNDVVGHGTHVAGLACAATNNGAGISGAGRHCHLIVEKVDFTDSSIAAAIVDATDRGADSINMSFGDDGSRAPVQALSDAIDYAFRRGVVLVAAAADDGVEEQGQPANLLQPTGSAPDLALGRGLSITSADFADGPSGAGFGTQVSLAAYGSYGLFSSPIGPRGLLSTFPANRSEIETGTLLPLMPGCACRASFQGDTRYAYLQGTSMAAPQVAAIAAVIRHLYPTITAGDVIRVLKQTARRPRGTAWQPALGWGIVNAGAAVAAARRIDRVKPSSRLTAPPSSRSRSVTLRWTGTDRAPARMVASGIRFFEVYRMSAGSAPKRIAKTTRHSLRVTLSRGRTYRFFTVATDRAGNREARPARADATVRVLR